MSSPRSSTIPNLESHRRKSRVTKGVLMLVVVAAAIAGAWIVVERQRSARRAELEAQHRITARAAGEDVLAAQAMAKYLAKMQAQLHDHAVALDRLEKKQVFSWKIHDLAEIDADRQMVRDFLASNSRLADTLRYGADLIRAELNTAHVPAEVRDSALAMYEKNQAPLVPLQMRLRQCDQTLGENALAILDLLDLNFGKWHWNEADKHLDFDNSILIAAFRDYARKASAAAVERDEVEKELTAKKGPHPRP